MELQMHLHEILTVKCQRCIVGLQNPKFMFEIHRRPSAVHDRLTDAKAGVFRRQVDLGYADPVSLVGQKLGPVAATKDAYQVAIAPDCSHMPLLIGIENAMPTTKPGRLARGA
jgi:hypothetical protein